MSGRSVGTFSEAMLAERERELSRSLPESRLSLRDSSPDPYALGGLRRGECPECRSCEAPSPGYDGGVISSWVVVVVRMNVNSGAAGCPADAPDSSGVLSRLLRRSRNGMLYRSQMRCSGA